MSLTIPGTPPSVAPSGKPIELQSSRSRIDFRPSGRAAALAAAWLILVCGAVILAVALPLPARIALCAAIVMPAVAAIRSGMLLQGGRAVHSIDWAGGWRARIGPGRIETPVTLRGGSFRVGRAFLLLWLQTCDGIHGVLIDMGRQDPRAIRRLCRQLHWPVSPS